MGNVPRRKPLDEAVAEHNRRSKLRGALQADALFGGDLPVCAAGAENFTPDGVGDGAVLEIGLGWPGEDLASISLLNTLGASLDGNDIVIPDSGLYLCHAHAQFGGTSGTDKLAVELTITRALGSYGMRTSWSPDDHPSGAQRQGSVTTLTPLDGTDRVEVFAPSTPTRFCVFVLVAAVRIR